MFHYSQYRTTDRAQIRRFIGQFPLALITTCSNGRWQSSHIPLFLEDDGESLFGHVDAGNAQFHGTAPIPAQLVFAGPNQYIPPHAYASRQLPTWNYLAVHASGELTLIDDVPGKLDILRRSAVLLDPAAEAFRVHDDDARVQRWIGGIRGLRFTIADIEGRFKLSQDKDAADVDMAARYFARTAGARLTAEMLLSYVRPTAVAEPAP
jgi:transcriptional regulator